MYCIHKMTFYDCSDNNAFLLFSDCKIYLLRIFELLTVLEWHHKRYGRKKVRSKNGVWPLWTANRLNKSIEIIIIIALSKWNDPSNMKYGVRKLDLSKHYAMNEYTFDVPLFLSASCLPSPFLFSITPLNSHWFAF